jgi:hypothetical protein
MPLSVSTNRTLGCVRNYSILTSIRMFIIIVIWCIILEREVSLVCGNKTALTYVVRL